MEPGPLVLFHDQCQDGMVSAWIAWRRFGSCADYLPVRYKQKPPDCTDRTVYILDFCYSPEVTAEIAEQADHVVIIDHHATAIADFERWTARSNVQTMFDIGHSGAQLTAQFFNHSSTSWIVDYAEDRDLWRWRLPHSKEINAVIGAMTLGRRPLDVFSDLNDLRGVDKKLVIAQGTGSLLTISSFVREVSSEARRISFAGHDDIPVVNLARPLTSEVLHELTKTAPFAVGWREEQGKVMLSLRSDGGPEGFNCGALAKQLGGGGHHSAAGVVMDFKDAWPLLALPGP